MFDRLKNKVSRTYNDFRWNNFQLKKNFDPNKALIIAGDPRGGTTWLAEILREFDKTALLWEPLWLTRERTFRDLNFSYRQFLPESEVFPEIRANFSNLFSGKVLNSHLCQFTSISQISSAQWLLIKFCRANQLLPWLTQQFRFKYAPIYIVRHPCAVVASQLRQGGWDNVNTTFQIPYNKLYPEFYSQHEDFLKSIDSKVKVLAATWCLTNAIPLQHSENNKRWITITYESLILEGEKQLNRIEKRWNIKLPESAFQKLNKASKTTVQGSPILENKGSQLEYWKKQLSDQQINDIMEVLDYFKIDLYTTDFLPTKSFF